METEYKYLKSSIIKSQLKITLTCRRNENTNRPIFKPCLQPLKSPCISLKGMYFLFQLDLSMHKSDRFSKVLVDKNYTALKVGMTHWTKWN